jgi:hypothetical protein
MPDNGVRGAVNLSHSPDGSHATRISERREAGDGGTDHRFGRMGSSFFVFELDGKR